MWHAALLSADTTHTLTIKNVGLTQRPFIGVDGVVILIARPGPYDSAE